ncbi:ABC transporter ATP-binding protein [Pseudooceanicola sp. MF1-13]|uniref:ABC transporter ATP-binding protein n=1 Tax=Pseudooceanicola sp. MF1-13 TaxID=3379095 RepID=UPI003891AAC7
MRENLSLIWAMLSDGERRRFALMLGLSVLMALFEVAGVAAIWPFLSLVGDPTKAGAEWLGPLAGILGDDPTRLTLVVGAAVLVLLVLGMAVRAVGTYAQLRFATACGYALSVRLLQGTLAQPYAWFLSRNSSDLSKDLLSEVDMIARQSILPAMVLTSGLTMTLAIAGVLVLADPGVALGLGGGLGLAYALVFVLLRRPLDRVGRARIGHNATRFRAVQEIGGSIKDIKLRQLEDRALTRFATPAQGVAQTHAVAQALGRLPRYVLEAVIYGSFVALILMLVAWRGQDLAALMPLLGLIGVAAIKLFPALQQVYSQASLIRFTLPALRHLHDTLTRLTMPQATGNPQPIPLKQSLKLTDIAYRYPKADGPSLRGVTVHVPKGATLGIVGGTGSGKTTLVDVILGLLTPTTGQVRVDNQPVTPDRLADWQRGLGYVPQQIFLSDDTITANIAFGVAPEDVDPAAVRGAARLACLADVVAQLPDQFDTLVGEGGVRLSGGQRQRIGIARALYHAPQVLVLDEATSALDAVTERAVIAAIRAEDPGRTIIMIAHRLGSLRGCNQIVMLEQGRIVARGSYAELIEGDAAFRDLAHA